MNELQKEMKELENNKYWKYITTLGERAVVYNNRINKEINLFKELSKTERIMLKKIFLKVIKQLDDV
tara:strand:+ start:4120 stop:4320 length:201 start_codon:yes stop_codon:yes gene_type:complete